MSRPRRGDVFVARVIGRDVPVVVVSSNSVNDASPTIMIVPALPKEELQGATYPNLVVVPQGTIAIEGEWVLVCTNVRSLRPDQLTVSAGTLPARLMTRIDNALRTVLQLN